MALAEALDRPEEIFFHEAARSRIAALDPQAPRPRAVEAIVSALAGEP
jgi:hypothetical protein